MRDGAPNWYFAAKSSVLTAPISFINSHAAGPFWGSFAALDDMRKPYTSLYERGSSPGNVGYGAKPKLAAPIFSMIGGSRA